MQDLRVTLIQANLHWENKQANLDMFSDKIAAIAEPIDVIVLPEMFNTGFSMQSEKLAEPTEGEALEQMKKWAAERQAVVTGSFIAQENGNYFNRLIWVQPDGTYKTYDKRHLFRMMDEHDHFSAGKEQLVVEWKGWRICPMVCYDLRFPVWSRNTGPDKQPIYDCLLYVANWPEARVKAWHSLLVARAIENHCYVAGVNRFGNDGNEVPFCGGTVAIDFKGESLLKVPDNKEAVETVVFSMDELESFREKFPVWMDADSFTINK